LAFEIMYGRSNEHPLDGRNVNPVGYMVEKRETEQEALDFALGLIRKNIGVRWVKDEGEETPKYEWEALIALANA
jgi:hypothetical protein